MKKKKKPRYIDANLVKKSLLGWETDFTDEEIEYTLDNIPTADVVEVVHGYWKCDYDEELGETTITCSVCGDSRDINGCYVSVNNEPCYNEDFYCPYCGAKMDGGVAE